MRIILSLIVALCFGPLYGQSCQGLNPCGTQAYKSDWLKEYQKNKEAYPDKIGAEIYIPLNVVIVGKDGGSGRFAETTLLKSLCTLNEDFAGTEMSFFLQEYGTIFDSEFFEHSDVLDGTLKMLEYNSESAINCYLVGSPAGNCGYNIPFAGIALSNSCTTPVDHTWAHELGHAFSLPHPFLGWEGGVGYEGETGHNFMDPAPEKVIYNYTAFKDSLILDTLIIDTAYVELLDGSNCDIAADGFCDTKPDYLAVRWPCDGNGESFTLQTDPTGATFNSDASLIMSYAFDACSNRFTDEQILAMRASAEEEDAELVLAESPSSGEVAGNGGIELYTPYDADLDYNEVSFNWSEVENADYYLFQLGLGDQLQIVFFDTIVQDPSLMMKEINSSQSYVWAVSPFNMTDFCDIQPSEILPLELTDVSSVDEAFDGSLVRLIPNILTDEKRLTIDSGGKRFETYKVYSVTGERIQKGPLNDQEITLRNNLETGMYFVVLNDGAKQISLKFLQQ